MLTPPPAPTEGETRGDETQLPAAAGEASEPVTEIPSVADDLDSAATGVFTPEPDATYLGDPVTAIPSLADAPSAETLPPAPSDVRPPSSGFRRPPSSGVRRSPSSGVGRSGVRRKLAAGDQGPLEIGQSFGTRYHIFKVLGVGGMGAVYQAWDAELGVSVAVKVIRPEIAEDPVAAAEIERRFKRELLLARQVTHKNVVRIHDLGEIDGIKYITMPYVDGSDLATVLKKETKLPIARVLRIARGIVSGLVSAHEAGVVHRDLKPANIMVGADDEPTIMDFGIARSAGRAGEEAARAGIEAPEELSRTAAALMGGTMAGAVIGTVEYMAPEQAKGESVDQRADIYAFGLILYDMLIGGRRSERAASAIAELKGRMQHAPPAPRSVNPDVPATVDAIITRCLEPDPAKRFQTTVELKAALDRLDESGKQLPIYRRVRPRTMAAAALLVVLLLAGTFYGAQWLSAPPKVHDPVAVLIADFQNTTSDTTFDRTLEQTLRRALEGASFITAYDRSRVRGAFGVQPPDTFDETAARELAVKEALGVVLAGGIAPSGSGYEISLKATHPVTGDVIADVRRRAANKDEVLDATTRMVADVRSALGDETSESAQLFAMRRMSATSLEAVRHHAAASEAISNNRFEEARQSYFKALEIDPNFGLAYQGLAVVSRNLGRLEEAEKYIKQALSLVDSMTERERFVVRGFYYRTMGDYQQCVKEYGELVAQFAADVAGHNQRALCLSKLRSLREAVDEMRQVVQILPRRVLYRSNVVLYSAYGGDFQTAEQEARAVEEPDTYVTLGLAFAQAGQGQLTEAAATYEKLQTIDALGASFGAFGLADLAMYKGQFSDAVRILEQRAAADLAAKNPSKAARKYTSVAYAHLARGQKAAAVAAAEKALEISKTLPIRFFAARIFIEAGAAPKARSLAAGLSSELAAEPQALGKILEGGIALESGDARQAIKILSDANTVLDTWLGHFDLGRAFLAAGAYPQADSEFDRCIKRRGEALSLLLDEEPTYGYFPPVYYYQGRVREAMKTAAYADAYREYLKIRGESREDPLLAEVRKRAGN